MYGLAGEGVLEGNLASPLVQMFANWASGMMPNLDIRDMPDRVAQIWLYMARTYNDAIRR